jgi:outer membrane murein-binding lipoprotein Lpp
VRNERNTHSLRRQQAERERGAAVLKANILADGAFHDGKERSRSTDWTTELRAQVSALTVERDEARANAAAFCGENERLKKEEDVNG